jgi:hypothetical protein
MLQAAGDLRLANETRARLDVVGLVELDLLEGHFAAELGVASDEDFSQATASVWAENPEPHGVRRKRVLQAGGAKAGGRAGSWRRSELPHGTLHVEIVDIVQLVLDGIHRFDGGQTLSRLALMLPNVLSNQRLQQLSALGLEGLQSHQVVGEGHPLVVDPSLHARDQLVAGDEVHLQGQDAKQEVSVRGAGSLWQWQRSGGEPWGNSQFGHASALRLES